MQLVSSSTQHRTQLGTPIMVLASKEINCGNSRLIEGLTKREKEQLKKDAAMELEKYTKVGTKEYKEIIIKEEFTNFALSLNIRYGITHGEVYDAIMGK